MMGLQRHLVLVALIIAALLAPAGALSGLNPDITFPLHARVGSGSCTAYLPVNCQDHRPTVNVPPQTEVMVYFLLYNYASVGGIQLAMDWDRTWTLVDLMCGSCLPGWLGCDVGPEPGGQGGPLEGTMVTAGTCLNGPALAVWARLNFVSGTGGCLYPVQSAYPFGDHAVDCLIGIDQINPNEPDGRRRIGKVCVETGGWDACDRVSPVEGRTWGAIKASYR